MSEKVLDNEVVFGKLPKDIQEWIQRQPDPSQFIEEINRLPQLLGHEPTVQDIKKLSLLLRRSREEARKRPEEMTEAV